MDGRIWSFFPGSDLNQNHLNLRIKTGVNTTVYDLPHSDSNYFWNNKLRVIIEKANVITTLFSAGVLLSKILYIREKRISHYFDLF